MLLHAAEFHFFPMLVVFFSLSRDVSDFYFPYAGAEKALFNGCVKLMHIGRRVPLADQPECVDFFVIGGHFGGISIQDG